MLALNLHHNINPAIDYKKIELDAYARNERPNGDG